MLFSYRYMVGYIPQAEVGLSKTDYALVGASSSAIARVVSQPLDVLKIRFQVIKGEWYSSSLEGLYIITPDIFCSF